mgnify:CR=1 FL=1
MKVLFKVGHPSHVHFFKNVIWNLESKGHETKIAATDKENVLQLLNAYGFKYEIVGRERLGLARKLINMFEVDYKMYKVAKDFKPDILVGESSMTTAQVSKLVKKPSIIFDDTEHAIEHYLLFAPFADVICTPSCYKRKVNPKKHVKYNGYKELAYLHPNQFKPDTAVLDELNLSKDDKFIIVRFASWNSAHDIADWGFKFKNEQEILDFLSKLENYGTVLMNSEIKLSSKFKKYMLPHLDDLHSLLYYATLYIGEGATLASEAGVLGTPWIFVSTRSRGYLDDQQTNYGLGYVISDPKLAMEKAFELLEQNNLKKKWQKKREKLLSEKIDVTKFMTEFIENYPESFYEYKSET